MDLQLTGKTVFISGSTAGIGFAIAKVFLQEGAKVIINGRTKESIAKALLALKEDFPAHRLDGRAADFSKVAEVEELLANMPSIDILINNVGIYRSQNFVDTSDKDWYEQFEVNVMSGVRLSRAFLPTMLAKNWGRILFVSSECATLVPADLIAYSMTKAALLSISRGLAQLTKGTAVTVNTIIPGSTLSEGAATFLENLAQQENKSKAEVEADFFKTVRTSSLLQRFASVEEVANLVAYLASPLAAATNGTAVKVDGGSMGGIL